MATPVLGECLDLTLEARLDEAPTLSAAGPAAAGIAHLPLAPLQEGQWE